MSRNSSSWFMALWFQISGCGHRIMRENILVVVTDDNFSISCLVVLDKKNIRHYSDITKESNFFIVHPCTSLLVKINNNLKKLFRDIKVGKCLIKSIKNL